MSTIPVNRCSASIRRGFGCALWHWFAQAVPPFLMPVAELIHIARALPSSQQTSTQERDMVCVERPRGKVDIKARITDEGLW